MAFTSFNLSRLNSVFRRAVAAFGFGTDSAIRARVQEEAAGSAVWARFAPSVAGYPVLPRVAGNLQIDEPAALTALAGGSDTLSYTAPDFKVGHTLIPLSEFSWGLPFDDTQDGGIAAQFADDWGYTLAIPRMGSTWTTPDLSDTGTSIGKRIAFINSNPGRFTLHCQTRSLLSWENTSVAEGLFATSGAQNYMLAGDLIIGAVGDYAVPGASYVNLAGNSAFLRQADGTIVRSSGRAMLKPNFTEKDPAGTTAWAAAEAQMLTDINSALTGGQKISNVLNGAEYQPGTPAQNGVPRTAYWAPATVYAANAIVSNRAEGRRYRTTAGGTSGSTEPSGTGTGISDGAVTWDYYDWQTWRQDPTTREWLDSIDNSGSSAYDQLLVDGLGGAKSDQEAAVLSAHKAVDSSIKYIYYHNGDWIQGVREGTTRIHQRLNGIYYWLDYDYFAGNSAVTDYPGWEFYRGYWASYTSLGYTNGAVFRGVTLPEEVTNAVGQNIEGGTPLMYPFVANTWGPGYSSTDNGPDDLFMGFMKFIYTCGAIGCVPGYYQPGPVDGTWTIDANGSDQVRAYVTIGHVQATFSHLEDYLRNGAMLDGDYDPWGRGHSSHISSKNVYGQNTIDRPSYEFVHDDTNQWYSKVVARKLNATNDWLICAWRCYDDGNDKTLNVTVAGHALSVNARRGGTLYHMDNAGTLTMLDPLSMDPSRTIATILAGL